MLTIWDFSVEVLARIFEEMTIEDAWTARQVCRSWYDVWGHVALRPRCPKYLADTSLSVDVLCVWRSEKGKCIDKHVISAALELETSQNTDCFDGMSSVAKWVSRGKHRFDFWPGAGWREYAISDLLTDIQVSFLQIPTVPDFRISLGSDIGLHCHVIRKHSITEILENGVGCFKDFGLSIETQEEYTENGKVHKKHRIISLVAPKWQVYALFIQHSRRQRRWEECITRHYWTSTKHLFRRENLNA